LPPNLPYSEKTKIWDLLAKGDSISSISRLPDHVQEYREKLRREKGLPQEIQKTEETDFSSAGSIEVTVSTHRENTNVIPNPNASMLYPIPLSFSLKLSGKQPIKHFQMHVWTPENKIGWAPEGEESGWENHGRDNLPVEFDGIETTLEIPFERWLYQGSSDSGDLLLPSSQSHSLPLMWLSSRNFRGTRILPWKLVTEKVGFIIGTCLLAVNRKGTLTTRIDEFPSHPNLD